MKESSLKADQRYVRWVLIGGLICFLMTSNLFMPWILHSDSAFILGIFVGICVGQVNLIAAWAALAPGNVLFRLPWSMVLGVLMWYSLIGGYRLQGVLYSLDRQPPFHSLLDMGEAVLLGIVLVVGIIVAQIPLWIAGRVFRWKFVASNSSDNGDRKQFNLRHLLLGMFLLSLLLGAARVLLPAEEDWTLYMNDELWALLGALIICNLLITIPCIWGSFARADLLVPLAAVWIVHCALLTSIEFGVLCLLLGSPGAPEETETFIVFLLLNLSQCGTVLGSFLLLRVAGLRFVRLPPHPTLSPRSLASARMEMDRHLRQRSGGEGA